MNAHQWLDQKFSGEYFSGKFNHLKNFYQKNKNLFFFETTVVTVAGTNGKGETIRAIASQLGNNEKTYALWTSPHIFSVHERFVFNGDVVEDEQLVRAFETVQSSLSSQKMSYFEFLFLTFLLLAKEKRPQYLLIEIGLGGRLDAGNIIDADIAVLTSISRDHQEFLGNSYRKILYEKLGILRRGANLISALELSYLQCLTSNYCYRMNVKHKELFKLGIVTKKDSFSMRNQKLAHEVISELNLETFTFKEDTACRLKQKYLQTKLFYYPSHNPDGIRKLVHHLSQLKYNNFNYIVISLSNRSLSDLRAMLKILKVSFKNSKILFYDFSFAKEISKEKQTQIKEEFGLELVESKDIFKKIKFSKENNILCTGSQYFFQHLYQSIESAAKR